MKKTLWIPILVLFGFLYVIGSYLRNTGYLNFYMFWILTLMYVIWLLMVGIPALAAFGFQCFACNASKSIFIRLIPTVLALAAIVYECIHPFYATFLYLLSDMLGLTHYLIIPVVLLGLFAGWIVKPKQS